MEAALKHLDAYVARLQQQNERQARTRAQQLAPQAQAHTQLAALDTERSRAAKREAINAHIALLRRESSKLPPDFFERRYFLLLF